MNVNDWVKTRLNSKTKTQKKEYKQSALPLEEVIKNEAKKAESLFSEYLQKIMNDHEGDQEKMVSSDYHTVNSNINKNYNQSLKNLKPSDFMPELEKGIAPKLIHKVGDTYCMAKPYYAKRDGVIPLSGWSTITTSNLYKAANLKDLIENVNVSLINSVPITVHCFSKNHTTASSLFLGGPEKTQEIGEDEETHVIGSANSAEENPNKEKIYKNINNINPLQARQIGVLDFLTGNYDRHGNNLLVADSKEGNYRNLVAIDHDRAFNYLRVTSPHDEYRKSAMSRILGDSGSQGTDKYDLELAYWWINNKDNIYKEMNNNLNEIKDHQLRKYIRRNFDERFQVISEWAKHYESNKKGFFERNFSLIITSYPFGRSDKKSIDDLKESLPDNKKQAVELLMEYLKKPRAELSPIEFYAIQTVASEYVNEMNDDDVVSFFAKADEGERIRSLKNDILMDMKKNIYKTKNKITKILKINEDLPQESRFLNPFWELYLTTALENNKKNTL